jgi:hypothetical protein
VTAKSKKKRAAQQPARTKAKAISAAVHERRDAFGATRSVTAMCDCDLLGRVLKSGDGNCVLDLRKYKEFYSGQLVGEEKAASLAAQADNLNVVGAKSLAAARRAVGISENNVKRFGRVPHAQVYKV